LATLEYWSNAFGGHFASTLKKFIIQKEVSAGELIVTRYSIARYSILYYAFPDIEDEPRSEVPMIEAKLLSILRCPRTAAFGS